MVRSRIKFIFKGLFCIITFCFMPFSQDSGSCAVPMKAHAKHNSALFKLLRRKPEKSEAGGHPNMSSRDLPSEDFL